MEIQNGQILPEGIFNETTEFDSNTGCPLRPEAVNIADQLKGKKIVIFGVPGAFTPTCSAKHLPGYVSLYEQLKAKGIDEIWCMAVNDGFVMAAWGRACEASGKVRMMADGSAEYARKLGLELDLTTKGMGMRCQRFALIADDGVVTYIGVEAPGQFEVSSAEAVLSRL